MCTNHSRKNSKLSFYRIPKDVSLRREYVRLIRKKTLKLRSSHTRICSAHFEGEKKKHPRHLPSIFPCSKQLKVRKPPIRRKFNLKDVSTPSHLSSAVESETEVEGAVEENTLNSIEVGELKFDAFPNTSEIIRTKSQDTQTAESGALCKGPKDKIKCLQEQISSLKTEVQQRDFSINRFRYDDDSISFYIHWIY